MTLSDANAESIAGREALVTATTPFFGDRDSHLGEALLVFGEGTRSRRGSPGAAAFTRASPDLDEARQLLDR